MLVIAVNGSPRKKRNTATLLAKTLEGAASVGAETELFHLYDMDYKGCVSCFACKTRGGKSYGRCAVKDGLTPLLEKVDKASVIVLGSPLYLGIVTGEMRSFLERLLYPYFTYTDPRGSLFPRKVRTAFIYTMGATEEAHKERGFANYIFSNDSSLKFIFGHTESLCSFDTSLFDDYSKVVAPGVDAEEKARRRAEVFPVDCTRAFEMGARLTRELAE